MYASPGKEILADFGMKAYMVDTLLLTLELVYPVFLGSGEFVVGMGVADVPAHDHA